MNCVICKKQKLYTKYRCKNCYCNSSTDKELDKYLLTEKLLWN
mgnify:FL=1